MTKFNERCHVSAFGIRSRARNGLRIPVRRDDERSPRNHQLCTICRARCGLHRLAFDRPHRASHEARPRFKCKGPAEVGGLTRCMQGRLNGDGAGAAKGIDQGRVWVPGRRGDDRGGDGLAQRRLIDVAAPGGGIRQWQRASGRGKGACGWVHAYVGAWLRAWAHACVRACQCM
eukprot:3172309-Pleurochrysis_carterae.AAC.2